MIAHKPKGLLQLRRGRVRLPFAGEDLVHKVGQHARDLIAVAHVLVHRGGWTVNALITVPPGRNEFNYLEHPVVAALDGRENLQVPGEALAHSRVVSHSRRKRRVLLCGDHERRDVGGDRTEASGLLFLVVDATRSVPIERMVQAMLAEGLEIVVIFLEPHGIVNIQAGTEVLSERA